MSQPLDDRPEVTFEVSGLPDARPPHRRSTSSSSHKPAPRSRRRRIHLAMLMAMVLLVVPLGWPGARGPLLSLLRSRLPVATSARVGGEPGDVWSVLGQRPWHLQTLSGGMACPVTTSHTFAAGASAGLGDGPVYVVGPGSAEGALRFTEATSQNAFGVTIPLGGEQQTEWFIQPDYQGPVLIRGHQLDGQNALHFQGGLGAGAVEGELATAPTTPALRLTGASGASTSWQGWPVYVVVAAPGCYAYQIDGLSFSEHIVFQAIASAA